MTDHLPDVPVAATVQRTDGRWTLRLERQLDYPAERVWAALTQSQEIRRWAPYVPDRNLDRVGEVALPQAEAGEAADGPSEPGRVIQVEPLRLLVLLWGDHEVRYELRAIPSGVQLILTHTFDRPVEAPEYAAGWHLCLAALRARLGGLDVPPVAGSAAREHGWEGLHAYARLLSPQSVSQPSS